MQTKSANTRELFVVTEVVTKFRHYLLGKKFIISTNHQSLKALTDQNFHTLEQHKWLHKLLGYTFEIKFKPGKENVAADALSRCFFTAWSSPQSKWLITLKADIASDNHLSDLQRQCINGDNLDPNFSYKNG